MSDFQELEYKYKADDITLEKFIDLMNSLNYARRLDTSSWDKYYTKEGNKESFIRFRQGDTPELTKKVKTVNGNNWVRLEVDLPLDVEKIREITVDKFLELDEYKPNFKIYKTCFIFFLDNVNYVYYIVYDKNLKEQGRFVEVEVNKNKVAELDAKTESGAVLELKLAATKLETLGVSPQNRLKRSLFEMFVK